MGVRTITGRVVLLASIPLALGIYTSAGQTSPPASSSPTSDQTGVPAPTPYQVVNRGASFNVWQRTEYGKAPSGAIVPHVHSYTELASGLNYRQKNQWTPASDEIDIQPDGTAAAIQGQHQAYFPADIYEGTIRNITPDGLQLQSQPAALAYDDGHNTVIIAVLTNSIGELASTNKAIYKNAFSGIKADILYNYKKGGFEQDIILHQQPPSPASLGLDLATTRLQVLTEFFNPPTPAMQDSAVGSDLADTTLKFGSTTIGRGRAFLMDGEAEENHLKPSAHVPVFKTWLHLQDRTFLVESVPLPRLKAQLQSLPSTANSTTRDKSALYALRGTSRHYQLPGTHILAANPGKAHFAKADTFDKSGLVLDYITINSAETNFTFEGDYTYYINGEYDLKGITTFEGGAVIKMGPSGQIDIDADGSVDCETGPYRPLICTSPKDSSIGEAVQSGTPSFGDYGVFLFIYATNATLHDLRVNYGLDPISQNWGFTPASMEIWDCQFLNVDAPIWGYNLKLHNLLISRSTNFDAAIICYGPNLIAENVTADGGAGFIEPDGNPTIALTNCLITSQPMLYPVESATLVTNCTVYIPSSTVPVYQTVGAASYYLTNGSPARNAGTTNINPVLLAELQQKTTYPPLCFADGTVFSTNLTLSPCAQRDTNAAPDAGYHYDPIDYVVADATLDDDTTVNLTSGTVLGWYFGTSGNSGLMLSDGANFNSVGTVTSPCWFTHISLVQEGNGNWAAPGTPSGLEVNGDDPDNQPEVDASFTKWSGLNFTANIFQDNWAYGIARFSDCEFYDSAIASLQSWQFYTNCCFYRMVSTMWSWDDAATFTYQNCTFYNGAFLAERYPGQSPSVWTVQNCAYDGTALWYDDETLASTNAFFNNNAYNTNNLSWQTYQYYSGMVGTNEIVGPRDLFTGNFNWQASWFGSFYLPPDSPLIDAGNPGADRIGFYDFTTQTNQAEEQTSPIDIGYHYVATDQYGIPLETLTNNAPDYLVDANGDGLPDWWELAYFGTLSGLSATNLDSSGNTFLHDYLNNQNPNVIQFVIRLGNQNFSSTNATGTFLVQGGIPSREAVLINDNNFADAVWTNFDGIIHLNLGPTDGVYKIYASLQGFNTNALPTWFGTTVTLTRQPPQIHLTSPTNSIVATPYIQLQGFTTMPLASVAYDISNVLEVVTNQPGSITGHYLDTNSLSYTTDYFQCYDILLANGANAISLHCTDPAGNTTTTNLNLSLDFTTATNPIIQLTWPTNGMEICSSNFNLRGWTDDSSATIQAQIVDTNGDSNVVNGIVERTGVFWENNLPLAEGTNWITLWITNAAGLSSETNIFVIKSDMTLTLTTVSGDLWNPTVNVSGNISDTTAAIWVNGVQGTNYGNGTWSASYVPVSSGGIASFDLNAIPTNTSDPGDTTQMQKPTEVTLDSAIWSTDVESYQFDDDPSDDFFAMYGWTPDFPYLGFYIKKTQGAWSLQNGGYYNTDMEFQDNSHLTYYAETSEATYSQQANILHSIDTEGFHFDATNSPGSPPSVQNESQYELGSSDFPSSDGWNFENARSTQVRTTLHIGGTAIPGQQVLVECTINVPGVSLVAREWNGGPIPNTDVAVDGLGVNLGADGTAFGVSRPGASISFNLIANVPDHTFEDFDAIYAPSITANGTDLSTNIPDFCVGQDINLMVVNLPSYTNAVFNWSFPGTYYNAYLNTSATNSPDPYIDSNVLTSASASVWWISGGNPAVYDISAPATLYFSNGKALQLSCQGKINMYRPTSTVTSATGVVDVGTNYIVGYNSGLPLYQFALHFGNLAQLPGYPDVGIKFINSLSLPAEFGGSAGWTQVINLTLRRVQTNNSTANWYKFNVAQVRDNPMLFGADGKSDEPYDSPALGPSTGVPPPAYKTYSVNENFSTWLMFTPYGGHEVPLKKLNWGWSGVGTWSGSNWILSSTNVTADSSGADALSYPHWTNIVSNFKNFSPE